MTYVCYWMHTTRTVFDRSLRPGKMDRRRGDSEGRVARTVRSTTSGIRVDSRRASRPDLRDLILILVAEKTPW